GLEIVRYDDLGHAAEELEGAAVGGDPVRQRLRVGSLGVGVATGPQHGDEDLGRARFARGGVDDLDGLPGIVDEELLAGAMLLPHDEIDSAAPVAVAIAEAAVLIAVGMYGLVFLPQQHERHALAAHLLMEGRPVRL